MLCAATVSAQDLSAADTARIKAAIVINTFDELQSRCTRSGGFNAAQRAEVDTWLSGQSVDRVRTHIYGAGLSASLREQARAASVQVIQQVAASADPCFAATGLTRTADAQFAGKLPQLLAGTTSIPDTMPADAAKAADTPTAATPAPAPPTGDATQVAADIEGFGFDSCTRIGYGGMVMYVPCPVVLFKNGDALTDVEGLSFPQGLAAHRAGNPKKWTRWRRQGERVQLMKADGWKNITYTAVYSTLPKGFRLDGRFHSMNGGGNSALGGGQAVAAWTDYLFRPDGRMQRDGGASASSTGTGVDVTAGSTAAARTGRYRIDGLVLAIDYDDGAKERRIIIADPKDEGKGTMWLDGTGYVARK
jgi:hypothetical protein